MPRKNGKHSANRRAFLKTATIGAAVATLAPLYPALGAARELANTDSVPDIKPFELDEITIADLQEGMKSGKFTARALVEKYSHRIDEIDKSGPAIHSIIEMNPDALSIAEALDQERKAKGPRGPLHGVPVLIKDNIDTADKMMTTAGSLALLGSKPAQDSMVAKKLRSAGAIILAKTNLSGPIFVPATPPADGAGAAASRKTLTRSIAIPVAPVPARGLAYRQTYARSESALKRTVPSSAPRRRMVSLASSPPSVWSAAAASFRYRTLRMVLVQCAEPFATPRSCWARLRETTLRIRPRPRARESLIPTTHSSATRLA